MNPASKFCREGRRHRKDDDFSPHRENLMTITRRIYVSLPADPWLPDNLNKLKWGIVDEIEKLGYTPEVFTNPRGKPGLASAKAWHPSDADAIARRLQALQFSGCRAGNSRICRGRLASQPQPSADDPGPTTCSLTTPSRAQLCRVCRRPLAPGADAGRGISVSESQTVSATTSLLLPK
jgi:hypothetical protein